MQSIPESTSDHQLLVNKYRQRKAAGSKYSSVHEFSLQRKAKDVDKENMSIDLNRSMFCFHNLEKETSATDDSSITHFSMARMASVLNTIDKSLVDCFMVRNQAETSLHRLGSFW
jgi:hypothetical protein